MEGEDSCRGRLQEVVGGTHRYGGGRQAQTQRGRLQGCMGVTRVRRLLLTELQQGELAQGKLPVKELATCWGSFRQKSAVTGTRDRQPGCSGAKSCKQMLNSCEGGQASP